MVSLEIYKKEIFDFLKTVSIKFTPFANYYRTVLNNCALELRTVEDRYNKYYLNLCGEYGDKDIPIKIISIDTNEEIILNKQNLIDHPKTASVYRVPNIEFDILCERYPTQKGLIKSIIYPASDMDFVLNSDNLTLLSCDKYLLHSNEQMSLISAIERYLDYLKDRWFTYEFVFEDQYLPAFWSMVWYTLPQVLLTERIYNIKTSRVHPFHIWEYLCSKGLKNYSDILTNKQALWLYRNIDYIYKNEGKQDNLIKLATNLLSDQFISLVGKTIFQQQYDKDEECLTVPEYISEDIVSNKSLKDDRNQYTFETVNIMNNRLFISELEVKNNAEYVSELEEKYALVPQNVLPTKLVEIQKNAMDTRYANLLTEFILDTLMYRFKENNIKYNIKVHDTETNLFLELTPGKAFALFHYCVHRSLQNIPIFIPNKFTCRIAYLNEKIKKSKIPNSIWYDNVEYPIKVLVDVDRVLNEIPIIPGPIVGLDKFIELTAIQFKVMQHHLQQVRTSGNALYMQAMCAIYDQVLTRKQYHIELVEYKEYDQWFNSDEKLRVMIDHYESLTEASVYYKELAKKIFYAMVPIQDITYREFIGNIVDQNNLYEKLTDLLDILTSYNITFLDTERIRTKYLFIKPLAYVKDKNMTKNKIDLLNYFYFDMYHRTNNLINYMNEINYRQPYNYDKTYNLEFETQVNLVKEKQHVTTENYYLFGSKSQTTLTNVNNVYDLTKNLNYSLTHTLTP